MLWQQLVVKWLEGALCCLSGISMCALFTDVTVSEPVHCDSSARAGCLYVVWCLELEGGGFTLVSLVATRS